MSECNFNLLLLFPNVSICFESLPIFTIWLFSVQLVGLASNYFQDWFTHCVKMLSQLVIWDQICKTVKQKDIPYLKLLLSYPSGWNEKDQKKRQAGWSVHHQKFSKWTVRHTWKIKLHLTWSIKHQRLIRYHMNKWSHSVQHREHKNGSRGTAPCVLTLGLTCTWVVSFQPWPFTWDKRGCGTSCIRVDILEKIKVSVPARNQNPSCTAHNLVTALSLLPPFQSL